MTEQLLDWQLGALCVMSEAVAAAVVTSQKKKKSGRLLVCAGKAAWLVV